MWLSSKDIVFPALTVALNKDALNYGFLLPAIHYKLFKVFETVAKWLNRNTCANTPTLTLKEWLSKDYKFW